MFQDATNANKLKICKPYWIWILVKMITLWDFEKQFIYKTYNILLYVGNIKYLKYNSQKATTLYIRTTLQNIIKNCKRSCRFDSHLVSIFSWWDTIPYFDNISALAIWKIFSNTLKDSSLEWKITQCVASQEDKNKQNGWYMILGEWSSDIHVFIKDFSIKKAFLIK